VDAWDLSVWELWCLWLGPLGRLEMCFERIDVPCWVLGGSLYVFETTAEGMCCGLVRVDESKPQRMSWLPSIHPVCGYVSHSPQAN
jgi:hypothetical protein